MDTKGTDTEGSQYLFALLKNMGNFFKTFNVNAKAQLNAGESLPVL